MTVVTPYLLYEDCAAALDFLARAFGFEEVLRYTGEQGFVSHAEMRLGEARIFLGDPGEGYRNPRSLGAETVGIHVQVEDGVDELCERARAADAEISDEPEDKPYGERQFTARDPEGHVWWIGMPVRG